MSIFIFRRLDFTNINRVYECELWLVIDRNVDLARTKREYKSTFLKKTLVYISDLKCYYDLSTNTSYYTDYKLCYKGDIYIKPDTLVPISTLIDTKYDNIPKTRILKKYKNRSEGSHGHK